MDNVEEYPDEDYIQCFACVITELLGHDTSPCLLCMYEQFAEDYNFHYNVWVVGGWAFKKVCQYITTMCYPKHKPPGDRFVRQVAAYMSAIAGATTFFRRGERRRIYFDLNRVGHRRARLFIYQAILSLIDVIHDPAPYRYADATHFLNEQDALEVVDLRLRNFLVFFRIYAIALNRGYVDWRGVRRKTWCVCEEGTSDDFPPTTTGLSPYDVFHSVCAMFDDFRRSHVLYGDDNGKKYDFNNNRFMYNGEDDGDRRTFYKVSRPIMRRLCMSVYLVSSYPQYTSCHLQHAFAQKLNGSADNTAVMITVDVCMNCGGPPTDHLADAYWLTFRFLTILLMFDDYSNFDLYY